MDELLQFKIWATSPNQIKKLLSNFHHLKRFDKKDKEFKIVIYSIKDNK